MIPKTTVDFVRDHLNSSTHDETQTSRSEIALVRAAKITNKKNNIAVARPPVILAKRTGSVSKIRLGPAPGSSPFEKTIGKMMSPAIVAMTVSIAAI